MLMSEDVKALIPNQREDTAGLIESAFRYAPLSYLIVCPFENRIVDANEEVCRKLQEGLPELKNTPVHELFSNCVPELIGFTDEIIEKERGWSDNLFLTTPQGSRQIETLGKRLRFNDRVYIALIFQEFSEADEHRRKVDANWHYKSGIQHWRRMEKVFNDFENENRLILDAAGEGIYGVDAEGMTTFLNPAAERILGWKAEELHGKNIHYTIHARHEDGGHYHIDECPIYQAFQEGVINTVEHEVFWHKDGHAIQVEYTSTPIKDGDQVVGAVVIFRDVTEKRLAQQQLIDALTEVDALRKKLEYEKAYLEEELSSEFNHHQIVGNTEAIRSVLQKIELVAKTDSTVLIHGESGTGKELIARAIHEESERSGRSLIRVNCAAIPYDLFESEFFGHVKGAFTGANETRMGRFELADGGTLFLDEVGEIPLSLQGKLLRVLQEQQFERVGESKTRTVNVRIIAATNQDLKRLVETGDFREDLYFRLNVFPIESIPLRERKDDIPLLAQHFLNKAKERTNKRDVKISLSQLEVLKAYAWPGNIRELENIIERQVILARNNQLNFDSLKANQDHGVVAIDTDDGRVKTADQMLQLERENLVKALNQANGKVSGEQGAANLLGIPSTTLASKIKKFKIQKEEYLLSEVI